MLIFEDDSNNDNLKVSIRLILMMPMIAVIIKEMYSNTNR